MFTTISIQRLSTGTIYKLWLIGLTVSMTPLGLLLGIFAMLGFKTVTWNGQPLYGVAGLIAGPLLGVLLAVLFTAFLGYASAIGLWVYSKVRPLDIQARNIT